MTLGRSLPDAGRSLPRGGAALLALLLTAATGCKEPPPRPLSDAVEARDLARVRELAPAASPGERTGALGRLLGSAWELDSGPAIAAVLLAAGADPNGTWDFDSLGRSEAYYLELAVVRASRDVVRLLIEKGADVKGRPGGFALLRAASGQPAVVRILLDAGADPSFEWKGDTPLSVATRNGNAEAERLLRERLAGRR